MARKFKKAKIKSVKPPKERKQKLKESTLASLFIEHFSDCNIFNEVPCGSGYIDFVAERGNDIIAVEVKTTLNFKVVEQAWYNKKHATYSYIAIPKASDRNFQYKICRDYGIGVLIHHRGEITEIVAPQRNEKLTGKISLKEYMKDSVSGSKNDRITPFRNTINEIAKILCESPGNTGNIKTIISTIEHHYSNARSAIASITKYCEKEVIKDFKVIGDDFVLNTRMNIYKEFKK